MTATDLLYHAICFIVGWTIGLRITSKTLHDVAARAYTAGYQRAKNYFQRPE